MLGYHNPLGADTPQTRHPLEQTPPLDQTHPLDQTAPWPLPPEQTPPGPDPPGANTPPPEADSGLRSMSGRYASYWNAFLFILFWKDVDGRLLPVLHQHVDLPRGEHELLLAAEDMGRNGDTQRVEGTGQSRRLHKQQGNLPQQPPGKTMVLPVYCILKYIKNTNGPQLLSLPFECTDKENLWF